MKKIMNINELKDDLKLSALEEETNVIGRVKGLKRLEWTVKVVQNIMDLLFHGTTPSAVPCVIELSGEIHSPVTVIKELPSVDYVRKFRHGIRTIATTIATTIASYRLAKNNKSLIVLSCKTNASHNDIV